MKKYIILSIILFVILYVGFIWWKTLENQKDPYFWFLRAQSSQKRGDYDEAIKHYDKTIELILESTSPIIYLLNANYTNNNLDKTIKCYEKAIVCYEIGINFKIDDAEIYYNMGDAYYQTGNKYNEAIKCYEKAIQLKPDYAEAYYNMGRAYDERTLDKAISDYVKVKTDIITGKDYITNREMAFKCYEKAIQLKSDYAEAYNSMGEYYYYYRSYYNKAIECYEKAIESKLDYAQPYYNMGNIYFSFKRNCDEAIKYYEKAVELKTDDANMYYRLGNAYYDKGNYEKAIEYYEKAIEVTPVEIYPDEGMKYYDSIEKVTTYYYCMELAYERLGNTDKVNECNEKFKILSSKLPPPQL